MRLLLVDDAVLDEGRGDEHLHRGHASVAVGAGDEAHGHGGLQHDGQLQAYLLLLVRREDRDDAVDGLGGVEGVEGREHQVARLRRVQRRLDGLQVAHFADQHDVGVLAQRAAERVGERARVHADLALRDDGLVVLVQVFDRVLDGDDVRRSRVVDVVDHGREGGALAAARGAGHEHEAALLLRDLLEDGRQVQLVDRLHLEGDDEHGADGAALLEDVAAEPAEARHAVGEVDLLRVLEPLALGGRHDGGRHLHEVLVVQLLVIGDANEPPMDAGHGIGPDLQVKVRRSALDGQLQEIVDMHDSAMMKEKGAGRKGAIPGPAPRAAVPDAAVRRRAPG